MRVFIPTKGRGTWEQQRTLRFLGGKATLVVDSEADLPPGHSDYQLAPTTYVGIKRQMILNAFGQDPVGKPQKIVMMDDDLDFLEQNGRGGATAKLGPERAWEVLAEIESLLDTYPLVGLALPYMLGNHEFPVQIASGMIHVHGINMGAVPNWEGDWWPNYTRVRVSEDHDVNLQFLARGIPTAMSTRFLTRDKPNAAGGCSTYRNDSVSEEATDLLAQLWPGLVTKLGPGRPRFHFKKALKKAPLR